MFKIVKEDKNEVKEILINKLNKLWKEIDPDKDLLDSITNEVNKGKDGAEILCDWCRDKYDEVKEENGMEDEEDRNELEDLYNESCPELQNAWDASNWYLDYCNGAFSDKEFLDLIQQL